MATTSLRSGRNLVLIGYGAVTVSLGRIVVDLFSQLDSSTRLSSLQQMERRIGWGDDVMLTVLILGLLLGVCFAFRVAKTSTESTQETDLAKVVSLVLAGQSALFAIGVLVNIVNNATLNFAHFTHSSFGFYGWAYPVPGGLLLASAGYFKVWRAVGARSMDAPVAVSAADLVEDNSVNRRLES
jgi:hypothetical protein